MESIIAFDCVSMFVTVMMHMSATTREHHTSATHSTKFAKHPHFTCELRAAHLIGQLQRHNMELTYFICQFQWGEGLEFHRLQNRISAQK